MRPIEILHTIYNRRPLERELTFRQWLRQVQHRAHRMFGEHPQTMQDLLAVVQRNPADYSHKIGK